MYPRKVLIVDDSRIMHKMYAVLLEEFPLVHAFGGAEGITLLAEHREIDLIILDIVMPPMNGVEFLARVRAKPIASQVPVIVASFEDRIMDSLRHLERGVVASLKKPVTREALHEAIRRLPAPVAPQVSPQAAPQKDARAWAREQASVCRPQAANSVTFGYRPAAAAIGWAPAMAKLK